MPWPTPAPPSTLLSFGPVSALGASMGGKPPRARNGPPQAPQRKGGQGRKYKRSTDRPDSLDVGERRADVLAIARTQGLWSAALHLGWEPEDLEQEVLLRIHRRQSTARSAYDPQRAGVGKYLWVSTRSVLGHIVEAAEIAPRGGQGGRRSREVLGYAADWFGPGGEDWSGEDV